MWHAVQLAFHSNNVHLQTPANPYTQLAFSYFDSTHCGYLMHDDIIKLMHNCGIHVSKKVWANVKGESTDKVMYRGLPEPLACLDYDKYVSSSAAEQTSSPVSNGTKSTSGQIFEKDGNVYDVLKLIEQSDLDEKRIALLTEQLKSCQNKMGEIESDAIIKDGSNFFRFRRTQSRMGRTGSEAQEDDLSYRQAE